MIRLAPFALVVLAACPPPAGPRGEGGPPVPGVGCPTAANTYVAYYLMEQVHTGWVLPLFDAKLAATANLPDYVKIDPAEAQASGVPAAPASVWLILPGAPPCKATAAGYYAAKFDEPPNRAYGVELEGCAAPQNDEEALALISEQPPSECVVAVPHPIASRLGQMDAQHHWHRPTQETPIPALLAPDVPTHECKTPGCEMLWAFIEIDVRNQPVAWGGAVNWLQVPTSADPATQCQWPAETYSGFFVPGSDGKPVKLDDDPARPLTLAAVLADRTGAKVAMAYGAGEYASYDLASTGATLGHRVTWVAAPPEAYTAATRIGPECDQPQQTAPPPPPASAKPVSPYP